MHMQEVISFDEFKKRYDIPVLDHGRIAFPHGCNGAQARRNTAYIDAYCAERNQKFAAARTEYQRLVTAGEVREPTAYEHLLKIADGHPDNGSVQAARRILKKRYGVDYNEIVEENAEKI